MQELLPDSVMDTNACFFSLLSAGLWGSNPDVSLFEEGKTDWQEIFRLAMVQTVPGVVFDGMEMLPSELRPPRPLFMQWFSLVARIEQANDKLNHELAGLKKYYQKHQIPFILLKGQGNAALYPCPGHRQCGDIDLYTGKENYEKVNSLILEMGLPPEPETEKHIGFTYHNVSVENHLYVARFSSPLLDRRLQRFSDNWLGAPGKHLTVYDEVISIPAPGFNAIYLLLHSLLHFIQSGVGLRQVCDWALVLRVYAEEIDHERLIKEVKYLKLEKAFSAFGYIAVCYLKLPESCLPFAPDKKSGELLLSDILEGGNFGLARGKIKRSTDSKWRGKWRSFSFTCRRCLMMNRFCPSESRWYPYCMFVKLVHKVVRGVA